MTAAMNLQLPSKDKCLSVYFGKNDSNSVDTKIYFRNTCNANSFTLAKNVREKKQQKKNASNYCVG